MLLGSATSQQARGRFPLRASVRSIPRTGLGSSKHVLEYHPKIVQRSLKLLGKQDPCPWLSLQGAFTSELKQMGALKLSEEFTREAEHNNHLQT